MDKIIEKCMRASFLSEFKESIKEIDIKEDLKTHQILEKLFQKVSSLDIEFESLLCVNVLKNNSTALKSLASKAHEIRRSIDVILYQSESLMNMHSDLDRCILNLHMDIMYYYVKEELLEARMESKKILEEVANISRCKKECSVKSGCHDIVGHSLRIASDVVNIIPTCEAYVEKIEQCIKNKLSKALEMIVIRSKFKDMQELAVYIDEKVKNV